MSDASTAIDASVSAGPPPSADPQDPMPEGRWLFRRILTFAITAVVLAILCYIARAVHDLGATQPAAALDALYGMFRLMVWLLGLVLTYYLVAPSAEQITKLVQVGAALRSGVVFASAAKARSAEGESSASSTAGRGVVPRAGASADRFDDIDLAADGFDEAELPSPDPLTPEDTPWR